MKTKIVFFYLISLMTVILSLSGCGYERENGQIIEYVAAEKIETTLSVPESAEIYEDLSTLPQEIQDILYNGGTFFDVESQKEYTKASYEVFDRVSELKETDWGEYMVFDFDKDGEQELAVTLKRGNVDPDMRIFDKQEDMVYVYAFSYRGLLKVYTDGAIFGTSAADTYAYSKAKFDKSKRERVAIAEARGDDAHYWYIAGKKVSEEEFYQFISRYDEDKQIPWSRKELHEVIQ